MTTTERNLRARKQLDNFYDKIRADLTELQLEPDNLNDQNESSNSNKGKAEENLYGKITKEEFETILKFYDNQQQSVELRDKPVTCNRVAGGCYAKLLFSKRGFHQLGSANYLSSDLGIKDTNRASFLAGHNRYEIGKNEDVEGLRKYHLRLAVKAYLLKATEFLDREKPEIDRAKHELEEATRLDPKSADVAAMRGRYNSITHNYQDAIQDFKEAIQGELEDHDRDHIRIRLSEALADLGISLYHRGDFIRAETLFTEAIGNNPNNNTALIHIGLCKDKIRSGNIFSANYNYRK